MIRFNIQDMLAIVIATYPIFSKFKIQYIGIDISTFVLLLIFFIVYIKSDRKIKINTKIGIFPLFVYILIITPLIFVISRFIGSINGVEIYASFLRYARFIIGILSMIMIISSNDKILNWEKIIKYIRITVILSTIFIVIQSVFFHFFSYAIENPFLSLFKGRYSSDYENYSSFSNIFRPSSFFLEPAHLAEYYLCYLCIVLFFSKINYFDLVITISGIIICTSATGIIISIILFAIYFIANKFSYKRLMLFLILIIISIVLYKYSSSIEIVLSRVFGDGSQYGGNAAEARLGKGYEDFIKMPLVNKIFGTGFGFTLSGVYYSGYGYILNTIGIVGLIIFYLTIIIRFNRIEKWQKVIVLVYCILLVGAQMFTLDAVIYYLILSSIFIYKKV